LGAFTLTCYLFVNSASRVKDKRIGSCSLKISKMCFVALTKEYICHLGKLRLHSKNVRPRECEDNNTY
jgi:hypothetical protein